MCQVKRLCLGLGAVDVVDDELFGDTAQEAGIGGRRTHAPGAHDGDSHGPQQAFGQVGAAEPFEIHGQEGDAGEGVTEAQAVVELDTDEHQRPVVEHKDVVGEQVAVAVERPTLADPPGEQQAPPGQVALGQRVDLEHLVEVDHTMPVGQQAGGVVGPPRRQSVAARRLGRLWGALGPGVERGDQVDEVPQVSVDVGAHQGRQAALGWHAAHDHQVVASLAVRADHVGDPEVHVGGEAPVQLDLAAAHGVPHGPVAEVGKPRSTGFFNL